MLMISATATLQSISGIADALRSALADQDDVVLDGSNIVDVDLSFVQLIEAARKGAGSLRLAHPANASVTALLRRAGLMTAPTQSDVDFWFHGVLPQ